MSNRPKPKAPEPFPMFKKYQTKICDELHILIALMADKHYLENGEQACEKPQECKKCSTIFAMMATEKQLRSIEF